MDWVLLENQILGFVVLAMWDTLEQRHGRFPSQEELAEHSGIIQEIIASCEKLKSQTISLNKSKDEKPSFYLVENLPDLKTESPEPRVSVFLLRKGINKVLGFLDCKKSSVLNFYFGVESEYCYSMTKNATEMDLSAERIRKIIFHSLETLSHPSRKNQILFLLPA